MSVTDSTASSEFVARAKEIGERALDAEFVDELTA